MCWENNWRDIHEESDYDGWAIYKIRMFRNNKVVNIPRFLGVDKQGLLCFGQTTNFERRRKQFIRGWETGQGHAPANLLHLLDEYTNINTIFRDYTCQYKFKKISRNQNLDNLESQKIKKYVKKYGEVPPLNSSITDRYGQW